MKNAFERLGITPCLVISEAALREAFRAAGKLGHPDAGGEVGDFRELQEAFSLLLSPARRLQQWLIWRGFSLDSRGSINPALMDLFGEIGTVTQRTEAHCRKRDDVKSVLGIAMLEGETQLCREAIEAAISKVESSITRECQCFAGWEALEPIDADTATEVSRNLVFLEKWQASLRAGYSRLV
jgi:hypothetical protein